MSAALLKHQHGEAPVTLVHDAALARDAGLVHDAPMRGLPALATLASVEIETSLVANLSDNLHSLFDPVSDDVLPIYFGPLLGRLYLEGL